MNLAKNIDHTLLKPEATGKDIIHLCKEAKQYGFHAVCVQPCFVKLAAEELKDSSVSVATVIGFPLGANETAIKVAEAKLAAEQGAKEIDMVQAISKAKEHDYRAVEDEIRQVKEALPKDVLLKVILENCLLTKEEIIKCSEAALHAGADFIKTSTGFSTGGAELDDVILMKETVGDGMGIKASGGIRDLDKALAMINAGANRLGLSGSIAIMKELEEHHGV